MLLKNSLLKKIKAGEITLIFRKWKRPTVKSGGTLRTSVGVLAVDEIKAVILEEISEADAKQAGYTSKTALLDELDQRKKGTIYRIALHYKNRDPREALREKDELSEEGLAVIAKKLEGLDERSHSKPWTYAVLHGIQQYPGMRSANLSDNLNVKKDWLKRNVRKLKELGLTTSLSPGYRLSPRGEVVLKYLENRK